MVNLICLMNKKTLSHVSTNRAPLLWTMSIYANYILVVSLMMRVSEARTASSEVYGMYYFADGEHIDYGSAEVQDDNAYYGT